MDIRNELRAILRAARTANDNRPDCPPAAFGGPSCRGHVGYVTTGPQHWPAWVFEALSVPVFEAAGRSNVRPVHPARLMLHPAPWVRRPVRPGQPPCG
jgi:hypothetical protein